MTPTLQIIEGDWLQKAREIPDGSVHVCVTSPPYWALRDYGVAGQLGLEATPELYVAKMVEVFREVKRVLRDDGTLWLNLGDSFAQSGGKQSAEPLEVLQERAKRRHYDVGAWGAKSKDGQGIAGRAANTAVSGLKPKDLCGIPWRVAFALQADGWWLRSDIIYHKPNPMPESVTDRPTKAHEYLFLLSKSANYFYDQEAVKEDSVCDRMRGPALHPDLISTNGNSGLCRRDIQATRNKRDVWTIPSAPYSEAHFATFPPDMVKPCILAGSSARGCCPKCGAPWERMIEPIGEYAEALKKETWKSGGLEKGKAKPAGYDRITSQTQTLGWRPTCEYCDGNSEALSPVPCTCLDPFGGSGTSGMVALELGRNAILCELNPEYVTLARQRCAVTPGLAL